MHIGYASQSPRSQYWVIVNHGVQQRAKDLGIRLTMAYASTLSQQIAAITRLLAQGIDLLMLGSVAAEGLAAPLERVRAAGIQVVALATQLTDTAVTSTVRSDHMKGAALAATHIVKQLGGAGKVAHLVGPRLLQDNIDRAISVRSVFDRYPGINLVLEQEAPDWTPESGASFMRTVLAQHGEVRAVCAANDTLALGVAAAIARSGRTGKIMVTGFDAIPDALLAIHKGSMSATVNQSMQDIGRMGVTVAQRIMAGESVPPLVLSDVALVTRDNLLEVALDAVHLLPQVLDTVVERNLGLLQAQERLDADPSATRDE